MIAIESLSARRNLLISALTLRQAIRDANADGYTHWGDEWAPLVAIARRAARAERLNPEPRVVACRLCGGIRVCDLYLHGVKL